jgi:predicted naringenin-chalcone synthase
VANIVSLATASPKYAFQQRDLFEIMRKVYDIPANEMRKLGFMYKHSDIDTRHSVLKDYTELDEKKWTFLSSKENGPLPDIDVRMKIYDEEALPLSLLSINKCIDGVIDKSEITHLITVSCTGMSAPGLDLQIAGTMGLSPEIYRTSINFMGCYAAVHGLKMASQICGSTTKKANVLVVATELCSLHHQKEFSPDNAASSLLFGDGSAAILVSNYLKGKMNLEVTDFFSRVSYKGAPDMAWKIGSSGFMMTLSAYVPDLIQGEILNMVNAAQNYYGIDKSEIKYWCLHPGGKKILNAMQEQLELSDDDMQYARNVMRRNGNMSSPSVLYVLNEVMTTAPVKKGDKIFCIAMGPGLTMETFLVTAF